MTLQRDEQPAGAPSRRQLLRAGLVGAGGLGLGEALRGRASAERLTDLSCLVWECGQFVVDGLDLLWVYYAQDCQEPYGTYAYYSVDRLNPNLLGCGGPYCYPTIPFGPQEQEQGIPSSSPTRHLRFLQARLRKEGLSRPLPANRRFQVGSLGRVRVLEEGNCRVAGLKFPVHLVLVLVTPPDDQQNHQRPPLLMGIGVTTNAVAAPAAALEVLRPSADEQYFRLYRRSDDVFFHLVTWRE